MILSFVNQFAKTVPGARESAGGDEAICHIRHGNLAGNQRWVGEYHPARGLEAVEKERYTTTVEPCPISPEIIDITIGEISGSVKFGTIEYHIASGFQAVELHILIRLRKYRIDRLKALTNEHIGK